MSKSKFYNNKQQLSENKNLQEWDPFPLIAKKVQTAQNFET